jgi:hypothetical protein
MSFLAVSGVTATRVSPTVVSAGTPISMDCLLKENRKFAAAYMSFTQQSRI